jgi:hypothetical protein
MALDDCHLSHRMDGSDCIGKSRIAIPLCKFHNPRKLRYAEPQLLRILDTRPRSERFISPVGKSRIATPSCEQSMSSKTPISRLPGWLTAGLHYASVLLRCRDDSWPPLIGVSRIANSKCLNIMSPEFPISRWGQTPMVFDDCHLSHRWTAVIVPGFSLWIS